MVAIASMLQRICFIVCNSCWCSLQGSTSNATPHDCNTTNLVVIGGSYCNLFKKWLQYVPIMQQTKFVAICVVCCCNRLCYCNHLRIVLQLVGIIAMVFLSCNSISFCCNYLLLQQYWIWLLLLVTIATVIMGCNNVPWCCNC